MPRSTQPSRYAYKYVEIQFDNLCLDAHQHLRLNIQLRSSPSTWRVLIVDSVCFSPYSTPLLNRVGLPAIRGPAMRIDEFVHQQIFNASKKLITDATDEARRQQLSKLLTEERRRIGNGPGGSNRAAPTASFACTPIPQMFGDQRVSGIDSISGRRGKLLHNNQRKRFNLNYCNVCGKSDSHKTIRPLSLDRKSVV